MGPSRSARPPLLPVHLLILASLAGGPLSLCLLCDGATLPTLPQDAAITHSPVTDTPAAQPRPQPAPGPAPDAANTSQATSEQGGLVVTQLPDKEKALAGEDVVFSCLLSGGLAEGVGVRWVLARAEERQTVLEGNLTSEEAFAGRAFLSGNAAAGDFSMTLRNVSEEDGGVYRCLLTPANGTAVEGGGTKLSIRVLVLEDGSAGTLVGIVLAAVGVVAGLVGVTMAQLKDRLSCMQE